MSVERNGQTVAVLLSLISGCAVALPVSALADEESPDMALLEYLGSWEESDEDWELLSEDDEQIEQQDTRSDPAAKSDESQEMKHES